MPSYRIACLPGDGVGPEVVQAALLVLERLKLDAAWTTGDIGWEFWCSEGDPLPERTIELLRGCDAALFGAITSKPARSAAEELAPELKDKGLEYRSPIVRMRQLFDLYVCLRPCRAYPGNPLNYRDQIDLVVFRENTEDLYSGVEFHPVPEALATRVAELTPHFERFGRLPADEYAISCKINTRTGCDRIVRAAFDYARRHGRKRVTVVHKANVVRATDGLFLDAAHEVARDYPEIEMDDANVDAMTMWAIKNPLDWDVLVAPNLYGDIISDLCAQMVGGLGFGCSGNIGAALAVFEPTHGSVPKYAGQYKVNPLATILASRMMLEWLGEIEMADKLDGAVARVIREGKIRTYDMGGSDSTMEMAEAVAGAL